MASKLLNPISFCDVNFKSLIDISIYDTEHLLVTSLAFIKRYNVNEKKQVNSWVTKSWHPFTCGAVKDPQKNCIYAVTNNLSILIWPTNSDIEKAKKYSFTSSIKELIINDEAIYIIYSCGFVEFMSSALSRPKEKKKSLLKESEKVYQTKIFEKSNQVALYIQNEKKENFVLLHQISSQGEPHRIKIQRENDTISLTGLSLFSSKDIVTIWADGNLYTSKIENNCELDLSYAKSQVKSLKTIKPIKILELSQNYIALQGMKINEEGGLVVLLDFKFGVCVSSKALKMYRDPPLAWRFGSQIVVADGSNLLCIPVSLAPSTIASMFGTQMPDNRDHLDESLSWHLPTPCKLKLPLRPSHSTPLVKSESLKTIISSLCLVQVSEEKIADLVVAKLIDTKDTKLLYECLSSFPCISEASRVDILHFFIQLPEDHFLYLAEVLSLSSFWNAQSDMYTEEQSGNQVMEKSVQTPFSSIRAQGINAILAKPVAIVQLFQALCKLDFSSSLLLFDHLHFLLTSGMAQITKKDNLMLPTIEQTSLWLSALLDANYHQLIVTSEVEIQRKLLSCFKSISSMYGFLESMHKIIVIVDTILSTNSTPRHHHDSSYSIERLILP